VLPHPEIHSKEKNKVKKEEKLSYTCVCSYPYGPHLLHCLNYNADREEKAVEKPLLKKEEDTEPFGAHHDAWTDEQLEWLDEQCQQEWEDAGPEW
jgi:hypothetical protein